MGNIEKGGGGPPYRKTRRARGIANTNAMDGLAKLHTYLRDFAQQMKSEDFDLSAYEALAMLVFELAELVKEEYDKRHG